MIYHAASATAIPAVVIAGGRLDAEFAERAGTRLKARVLVGGRCLIAAIVEALESATGVGAVVVVGPRSELSEALSPSTVLIDEGATGPENVLIGLRYFKENLNPTPERVLVCTSDMPFVTAVAIESMIALSPSNADIAYPVVERSAYEARFPGSPNTFARLARREYTGGGVLLVRPAALAKNAALIEDVFRARKSQLAMARLLGISFVIKFLMWTLTISEAEARASKITGCACRAVLGAPVEVSADVDSLADYEYAICRAGASRNDLN